MDVLLTAKRPLDLLLKSHTWQSCDKLFFAGAYSMAALHCSTMQRFAAIVSFHMGNA